MPEDNIKNIISITGFGWSGSGAVKDLLSEFDGITSFPFEFRMLNDPDGIIDLENGIVNDWRILNCDITIRRFIKYIQILGRPSRFYYPLSYNYNNLLNNKFWKICDEYLDDIIALQWKGSWPYHFHEFSTIKWFLFRVLSRLRLSTNILTRKDKMYLSCSKEQFYSSTKNLFNNLSIEVDSAGNSRYILFDQLIPAINCEKYLKYFYSAKVIIVDRDPRDIFIDALRWSYIPTDNINDFILWFKTQREYFIKNNSENQNILFLRFEDLVFNYDMSISSIISFLSLSPENHRLKQTIFDPNRSKQNIGQWKKHINEYDFSEIEKQLSEYCYKIEEN